MTSGGGCRHSLSQTEYTSLTLPTADDFISLLTPPEPSHWEASTFITKPKQSTGRTTLLTCSNIRPLSRLRATSFITSTSRRPKR
jgi:hypothetical protein